MIKLTIGSFVLFSFLVLPHQQKPDFSGDWLIAKSKINFGNVPEWVLPKALKVIQTSDNIVVATTLLNENLTEKTPVIDSLSFDGKDFARLKSDGIQVLSAIKWINDDSLQIDVRSGKRHVTEIWSLQDNGNTLAENRNVEQANGLKYIIRVYYDKQ